jgi:hypothetical protein
MAREVKDILLTFARFEKNGTLPNTIQGDDASNRDTSDAPLWFGVVCEEIAEVEPAPDRSGPEAKPRSLCDVPVDAAGRTIGNVLRSIAQNYMAGTSNGIRMDAESALIWSPAHFTWMDTNFPAATPREGYPVEIQALWIRLLRQLATVDEPAGRKKWRELADRALASVEKLFWLEERGYYADCLNATAGQSASRATASDALRSNGLFLVSLGLVRGGRARRCVAAAQRYLVVPGALRSLAPLPVSVPLPVMGNDGRPLNDPANPYWGIYDGDEDTCRKPAYHGTAWTWTTPVFCEALASWDFAPDAVAAAPAYLGSMERISAEGRLSPFGLLDGDAPHRQRGCDAQAWEPLKRCACGDYCRSLRPAPSDIRPLIVHILIAPNAFKNSRMPARWRRPSTPACGKASEMHAGMFPDWRRPGRHRPFVDRKCRGRIVSASSRSVGRSGAVRTDGRAKRRSLKWRTLPDYDCASRRIRSARRSAGTGEVIRARWKKAFAGSSSASAVPRWTAALESCRRWAFVSGIAQEKKLLRSRKI